MKQPQLRNTFIYCLVATAICLTAVPSRAQLVFVPDVDLRVELNNQVPGAVNASGYIDASDPAVQAATNLLINISWTPVDLTGIDVFIGATSLQLYNTGTTAGMSIPAWPPALEDLFIYQQFQITNLPAFPVSLTYLSISGVIGLASLPTFPAGLGQLYLNYLPDLTALPTFPAGMTDIGLSTLLGVTSLSSIPNTLSSLVIQNLPLTTLPNWPTHPSEIALYQLSSLSTLPDLPTYVGSSLVFWSLWSLVDLPALPDTCPVVRFYDLINVSTVPPLPDNLTELEVSQCPGIACLPLLPNSLGTLTITSSASLVCLPNWPFALPFVVWNGVNETFQPSLFCTPLNSTCPQAAAAITGRVFLDGNGNGVFDAGESGYADAAITLNPGAWTGGVGPDGSYVLAVPPGNYTLTCASSSLYLTSLTPPIHTANIISVSQVDSLNDFAVVLQAGVQDLHASLTGSQMTTGNQAVLWPSLVNEGTVPMSGVLALEFDASFIFQYAIPTPDSIVGSTVFWGTGSLNPSAGFNAMATLFPVPGLLLGMVVDFSANALPIVGDQTPVNNVANLSDTLVGSYDPNDKTVSPTMSTPWEVSTGLNLDYTIRFQNTGTAAAARVIITDTLSSDLQWSTFSFVGSSHPCTWYVQNGVAVFTFDPIFLPDSTSDEAGSHGFARFHIQPVTSLANGATVSNEANIYFDFNPPVITEPCVFSVDASVGVQEEAAVDIQLFPNPATDDLWITLAGQVTGNIDLRILDVTGRVVLEQKANGSRINISITGIVPGAYRLELNDGAKTWAKGFVKR